MKEIKSKTVQINKSVETVFYALSDFRNLRAMQNDKIKDFQCSYDTCSFTINDMLSIELKITERKPFEYITIVSNKEIAGGFSFAMNLLFDKTDDWHCNLSSLVTLSGNSITLMLVKKQITTGIDMLIDTIAQSINNANIQ